MCILWHFSFLLSSMRSAVILLVCCACGAFALSTIACNIANNYGSAGSPIYNSACPADQPYCNGAGLCSECSSSKNSLCDCPPNYHCVNSAYNRVRNADFCAPYPFALYGQACLNTSYCGVQLNTSLGSLQTAYYGVCVSNTCRYCDHLTSTAFICQQAQSGADPRTYGSKNSARGCAPAYDAWNTAQWPLSPPLPTDPYAYEAGNYGTQSPTVSTSPTPSRAPGSSANPTTSVTPSSTSAATASLSLGASPSVTPVAAMNSSASAALLATTMFVVSILLM